MFKIFLSRIKLLKKYSAAIRIKNSEQKKTSLNIPNVDSSVICELEIFFIIIFNYYVQYLQIRIVMFWPDKEIYNNFFLYRSNKEI